MKQRRDRGEALTQLGEKKKRKQGEGLLGGLDQAHGVRERRAVLQAGILQIKREGGKGEKAINLGPPKGWSSRARMSDDNGELRRKGSVHRRDIPTDDSLRHVVLVQQKMATLDGEK